MKRDFFYYVLAGFASGIFLRSFFDFGIYFSILFILLGVFIVLFSFFIKEKEILFIFGLLLFSFGGGMVRYDYSGVDFQNLSLKNYLETDFKTIAMVDEEPDVRENNTRLTLSISDLPNEKILVTTDHYPKYYYGDKLQVFGKLEKPKNFLSEDGREFNYTFYLAKDKIYYQMYYPKIEYISSGNGNFFKEKLFIIKNSFIDKIKKLIPEPQASLLGGLVVGAKQSLGSDLQDDFRKVGLIHIVVLSGYNLTIVAEFIMNIFSFLPFVFSSLLGAISIISFTIMTGASATIVRASIMALLVMLAHTTGRVSQIKRTLFMAGFLMLFHNPNILVFDPSFQLSFMATFGLITLSPKLEKYFQFVSEKFGLRESLVAVLSTQIFVLPLILYMMGDFSLVAIPVNLLVLSFVPITMLFGFLSGLIGFFSTTIATPFAYITYGLLSYELKVVEVFSHLSFASFHIPFFPAWIMFVVYGIYFFIFYFFKSSPTSDPAT